MIKLNEKGQCTFCKRKPLTYKRDGMYYCCKCKRAYSMETQTLIENFAYRANGIKK